MVVAVKALSVPRDVFHRILMFVNPAVGHSVERVQALAALFDEMTLPAAEGMVAIWQSLEIKETNPRRSISRCIGTTKTPAPVPPRQFCAVAQIAPRSTERRNVS